MTLYPWLRALLFCLPPETSHHLALNLLSTPGVDRAIRALGIGRDSATRGAALETRAFGLTFPNPVGLAAGFDKNAVALPAWEALGFGFVEVGTVTPLPQAGNPRPRLFRFPKQQALVNRLGFPNEGMEAVARRLEALRASGRWPTIPVGINLGKGKETPLEEAHQDYVALLRRMRSLGDYFVINVSSPNTPGLRRLQEKGFLRTLLAPVVAEARAAGNPKPLLLKIAPDLEDAQLADILEVVTSLELDGIIATNTTLDKSSIGSDETGGLSGLPLQERSTRMIGFIHEKTGGRLHIIGVGGVFDADDVQRKLDAGASLVQLYTGFIYQGPAIASQICSRLRARAG